jgi:hypothetical protein
MLEGRFWAGFWYRAAGGREEDGGFLIRGGAADAQKRRGGELVAGHVRDGFARRLQLRLAASSFRVPMGRWTDGSVAPWLLGRLGAFAFFLKEKSTGISNCKYE